MNHWKEKDNTLQAKFSFKDFIDAFSFMTAVAMHAEKQNHHPLWTNVYNTVEFVLSTHDAGNIVTEKDYTLAKTITTIYNKFPS